MDHRAWSLMEDAVERLARALARGPVRARLVGAAAYGRPVRLAGGWVGELLVVAEPPPPERARAPWLEAGSGLRLYLHWKGREALAYPSPRYLEILQRGAVLHDPDGLLAATLHRFLESLADQGLQVRWNHPFPCWRLERGWPGGPLTPVPPRPAAVGRGG